MKRIAAGLDLRGFGVLAAMSSSNSSSGRGMHPRAIGWCFRSLASLPSPG